jgi:hypothetical protein
MYFFEASLSLPKNQHEARLIAENLEALARALREWPADAWRKAAAGVPASATETTDAPSSDLFTRLVARTAPVALDLRQRTGALQSAEAVAGVLRVLWPEESATRWPREADGDLLLATS